MQLQTCVQSLGYERGSSHGTPCSESHIQHFFEVLQVVVIVKVHFKLYLALG